MTDAQLTPIVTKSLERHMGKDPETNERANVQIVSVHKTWTPYNGNVIHVVATAWGNPQQFKARWTEIDGWMVARDWHTGLSADGKRL